MTMKKKIHYLILLWLFQLPFGFLSAQYTFKIQPEPGARLACPLTPQLYYLPDYDSTCHQVTVVNGSDSVPIIALKAINVAWADNGLPGQIIVRKKSGCTLDMPDSMSWTVPTKSLALAPGADTIWGPKQLEFMYGRKEYYGTRIYFPMRGSQDTLPVPVDNYTWRTDPEWNIGPVSYNRQDSVRIHTRYTENGFVAVKGASFCPNTVSTPEKRLDISWWAKGKMTSQRSNVYCGDPSGFLVSVYLDNGAHYLQHTVSLTLPPGWESTPWLNSPNEFVVRPNGQNGGVVRATVDFNDPGIPSLFFEHTIDFQKRELDICCLSSRGICTSFKEKIREINAWDTLAVAFKWKLTAVNPGDEVPAFPTEGTGDSIQFEITGTSLPCILTIDVTTQDTCYIPDHEEIPVWVGYLEVPKFLLDGDTIESGVNQFLCPGVHRLERLPVNGYAPCSSFFESPSVAPYRDSCSVYYFFVQESEDIYCGDIKVRTPTYCDGTSFQSIPYCRTFKECSPDVSRAFRISPNPASSTVYIEMEDSNYFIQKVTLRDMNGIIRAEVPGFNPQRTLSVQDMPAGIYTVEVYYGTGVRVERLVVIR